MNEIQFKLKMCIGDSRVAKKKKKKKKKRPNREGHFCLLPRFKKLPYFFVLSLPLSLSFVFVSSTFAIVPLEFGKKFIYLFLFYFSFCLLTFFSLLFYFLHLDLNVRTIAMHILKILSGHSQCSLQSARSHRLNALSTCSLALFLWILSSEGLCPSQW